MNTPSSKFVNEKYKIKVISLVMQKYSKTPSYTYTHFNLFFYFFFLYLFEILVSTFSFSYLKIKGLLEL